MTGGRTAGGQRPVGTIVPVTGTARNPVIKGRGGVSEEEPVGVVTAVGGVAGEDGMTGSGVTVGNGDPVDCGASVDDKIKVTAGVGSEDEFGGAVTGKRETAAGTDGLSGTVGKGKGGIAGGKGLGEIIEGGVTTDGLTGAV